MSRPSCVSPCCSRFAIGLFAGAFLTVGSSFAATYDVRALTKDKVRTFIGQSRQGSFGAPALNDKGSIAYACIIYGNNVDAFSNSTIVYRKKGKKKPVTALQAGLPLNDSFLPGYNEANTYGYPGTAQVYKISKAIAINNKDQIGFAAEVLNQVETDSYQDGVLTNTAFRSDDRSDYGCVFASSSAPGGFQNVALSIYQNYESDVLLRTLSINSQGSVPENATYQITATRNVPGFDYQYPGSLITAMLSKNGDTVSVPYYTTFGAIVATTESNVIGLPYETVFTGFSDAIIADKNRVFVVAQISDTGSEFDGIWQGTNPNLQPIVVKQTAAPTGGIYASFDDKAGPNRKGSMVAFMANLTGGSTTRAVFRTDLEGKNTITVAGVGDAAPGTNGTFADFDLTAVSDLGIVSILGSATVGTGTKAGIWVSDPAGKNLKLIVISGQTIKIGSETKTVTRLACNPVTATNKKGQVAFTASFTDKTSAVIVATP